ncbi:MAG: CBS domain-containing protein [candidate division WOR-3 bacterium]|nr:CBS domain-containing protein [candidate division WOR-3 bacterium]
MSQVQGPAAGTAARRSPEFFFISQLVGDKVMLDPGRVIGHLDDLEIKMGGLYPEVINLVVRRSFGRPRLAIPFSCVKTIDAARTVVNASAETDFKEFQQEPDRVLIKDMILDKRIIDTDESEVEVVYDIHLLCADGRMHVVHVDVSKAGMLRRLHLEWLARILYGGTKDMTLLSWRYVQPLPLDIDRLKGDVKLNITREKIADIHPADLADILEELSGDERMAVFNTLDTETAADALEETEPRVQRQLIATVRYDRIVELLNTMAPAQISDILEILPRPEAESLLGSLPEPVRVKVHNLLSQHEVKLVSVATDRILALSETATVDEALTRFRDRSRRYDVVMYVYIVNPENGLIGVVDIRELIQAKPEAVLASFMTKQLVTLGPGDSLADAAREFAQYGFRAIPMVDESGHLAGAVRQRDLLAVLQ